MRKVIKILAKVLSITILLSIFLPVAITLLLNITSVQNYVVDKAAAFATEFLGVEVSIGHIDLELLSTLHVTDFYVEDEECDTLLYAREAKARIASLNIIRDGLRLSHAEASGAKVYIRELPSGEINVRPIVQKLQKPNSKSNFKMYIDEIEADDVRFIFERQVHRAPEYGIDYFNMRINDISARVEDFSVVRSAVAMKITEVEATEQSGFHIDDLDTELFIDNGVIRFDNFSAQTPHSSVELPLMLIDGESWDEYKEYIDKVKMRGEVRNTTISTDDLGYFAPAMRSWGVTLSEADATFEGTVRDFEGTLHGVRLGQSSSIEATFHITGLPEWRTSRYTFGIKDLRTTPTDLLTISDNILQEPLPASVRDIVERTEWIDMRATVGGRLTSLRAVGNIVTGVGSISADMTVAQQRDKRYSLNGHVQSGELDLGQLLSVEQLQRLDARLNLSGSLGDKASGGIIGDVDVNIERVGVLGHDYSSIEALGRLSGEHYYAEATSYDDNLLFSLFAEADINEEMPRYGISLDLERADLHAIGINRRDSVSILSANIGVEAFGHSIEEMDGEASVANVRYEYPAGELLTDRIVMEISGDDGLKAVNMTSDFFEVQYQSRSTYREVFDYLYNSLKTYVPLLYDENSGINMAEKAYANDYTVLKVEMRDNINELFNAVAESVVMAPNTEATLMLNPGTNLLSLQASSEGLEYDGILMANCKVDINNRQDSLSMWLNSSGVYMGSRLVMPDFSLTAGAQRNRITLSAGFRDREDRQSGLLGMRAQFSRNQETKRRAIHIDIMPSHYTTATQQWRLLSRGIDIDSTHISIRDLMLTRPGQRLTLDGVASRERSDSLRLTLDNFDLSPLSAITSRVGYDMVGRSNGYASVKSALRAPEIEAHIDIDSISVNDIAVPPQQLTSNWDFEENLARIFISDHATADTLIRGYYQPVGNRYYASARMDGVKLELISPFLEGIISNIDGEAAVEANIMGQGRNAKLNGHATVDSLAVTVDYLNTRYYAPRGEVSITDNIFVAERIPVYDAEGNSGHFQMELDLNHLSNLTYDIDIDIDDMLVLDTDAKSSDLFYGHVYASGSASFRGDKRGLKMDIEATSGDNSQFFMPLSGKADAAYADFVKFKEEDVEAPDTTAFLTRRMMAYERKTRRPVNTMGSIMDIDMSINVLPNTDIQLVIDPTVGDVIKAKGNGQLTMHIAPKANIFELRGDYTISEGTYLFTLQNIWNKKFTVVPNSSIHWTGDPLGAMLNIDAVYSTKASLKPLIGNSMQGVDTSRAVPVDCYIKLTDELMSPTVTFDVQVPNVAPEIQTIIKSTLNDQQAIATQMFWLLAANTFAAEDTGAMGATLTATTGFELLSNQLSNWLSGDNYNIVVRYRPRTELTGDEVDVGFSKGLFDNRLIIEFEGGYLSDASVQSRQNATNFVGEAFITWLIDAEGTLRFKGFTQTIDRYGENQGMQETGIGLYYNESFNTFRELGENIRQRIALNKEQRLERRAKRSQKRAKREAAKEVKRDARREAQGTNRDNGSAADTTMPRDSVIIYTEAEKE